MKKILAALLILFSTQLMIAQKTEPYQLFNAKGKKVHFDRMVKKIDQADVILFGEHHNNSIAHWLQLQLTKKMHEQRNIVLGAEMFERDNAQALSDYVHEKIDNKAFDTLVRFWNNYTTDYKPLVEFAKENKIDFVATNVPRRYASQLYKEGEESLLALPENEKEWIAPLPFPYDATLPGYAQMMEMFKDSDHANENFPKAQAVKDATMGYFIVQNWQPNQLFIHFNGSYHSDNYEGIYWYLNQYKPGLDVKTITVVEQNDISRLEDEHKGKADYIIVFPKDAPKSY